MYHSKFNIISPSIIDLTHHCGLLCHAARAKAKAGAKAKAKAGAKAKAKAGAKAKNQSGKGTTT